MFLWRCQYYSIEELRNYQLKKLKEIIRHAYEKVPYYKKLFDEKKIKPGDIKSLDDLMLIPILSKDTIREKGDLFKAADFNKYNPHPVYTSGTTGTPVVLYWDKESNIVELLTMLRQFNWAGYKLGDVFLDIRSREADFKDYKYNWKCRGLEMSTDLIKEDNFNHYLKILRKYKPKLWRGHPSSMFYLCHLLKKNEVYDLMPKAIVPNAEALLPKYRQFIEEFTGVKILDSYGLKEHTARIGQCEKGTYHIFSEYGIVEIIKEDGTPAMLGEEGRIIATALYNKAFPLIRYDTRDYAVASDRKCTCGRGYPTIERIMGRIDDRILTIDGRWVSGLAFAFFFVKGIQEAQIVQEKHNELSIFIVPTDKYSRENEAYIAKELRKKAGEEMIINFTLVENLIRQPGKFKFVVSKLDKSKYNDVMSVQ